MLLVIFHPLTPTHNLLLGYKSTFASAVSSIESSTILRSPFPYYNTSWIKSVFPSLITIHLWLSLTLYTTEKVICSVTGWGSRDLDLSPRSESFLVTSLSPTSSLDSVWPIFKTGLKTLILPHLSQSDHILESFLKGELDFIGTSLSPHKQPRSPQSLLMKNQEDPEPHQPSRAFIWSRILKPGSWLWAAHAGGLCSTTRFKIQICRQDISIFQRMYPLTCTTSHLSRYLPSQTDSESWIHLFQSILNWGFASMLWLIHRI